MDVGGTCCRSQAHCWEERVSGCGSLLTMGGQQALRTSGLHNRNGCGKSVQRNRARRNGATGVVSPLWVLARRQSGGKPVPGKSVKVCPTRGSVSSVGWLGESMPLPSGDPCVGRFRQLPFWEMGYLRSIRQKIVGLLKRSSLQEDFWFQNIRRKLRPEGITFHSAIA